MNEISYLPQVPKPICGECDHFALSNIGIGICWALREETDFAADATTCPDWSKF